jgi:hypothetical protein
MEQPQPLPFTTITAAFNYLKHDVQVALHTQVGDAARLDEQIRICTNLQRYITQVCFSGFLRPDDS